MRIVIIGAGKIGLTLSECLSKEGNDVTLIDLNAKTIENAINAMDINGIVGNGVNISVQKEAGANRADVVIATTLSDEINMLCCLIAKKLGARRAVARIRDPEYSRQFILMLDMMGLDMVVNPEMESAAEISRLLRYPAAIGMDTFAKGRVDMAEMKIAADSVLDGIKVSELRSRFDSHVLVCAVQHEDEVTIPNGNTVLHAGDRIHFTAGHEALAGFFSQIDLATKKLRRILIIGGGKIAYYLARRLLDIGMKVKIIERDEKRCLELSELLPKAEIVLGDGTEKGLLDEIDFPENDACVALTGIDEENIIISMYAKRCGIEKIVTKINKETMTGLLETAGLDSVISPKMITANRILSYCRSMQNLEGSAVQRMYKLVDDRVEALEFLVSETSAVIGTPICELKLKKDLLISCIIRDNQIIIPGGSDVIAAGDSVIVTTINQTLSDLDDILR